MSTALEEKENGPLEKRSKGSEGESTKKRGLGLGLRNKGTPQSRISGIPKPGNSSARGKTPRSAHKSTPSMQKTAMKTPAKDEEFETMVDDILDSVGEFRKLVNKFPNIPKGAKHDHKKRAEAFKTTWMELRKSAGMNCLNPVTKFVEQVKVVHKHLNNENCKLQDEQDKLVAATKVLEQEVNALNLKVSVTSKENANYAKEKELFREERETLHEKLADLEKQLEEFSCKINVLTQEDAVTKEKLQNLSAALEAKKQELLLQESKYEMKQSQDNEEAERAKEVIRQTFENEKSALMSKITDIQAELSGKVAELSAAGTNFAVLQSKEAAAKEEIAALHTQLAEQKEHLHKQEIQAATTKSELVHLRERLQDRDSQSGVMAESLKQTLQMSEKRCEEFRLEKVQLGEKLGKVSEERRDLEHSLTQTRAELTKLQRDFEDARTAIEKLEAEKVEMRTSITTMTVKYEALMEEKQKIADDLAKADGTVQKQHAQIESFNTELGQLRNEKTALASKLSTATTEFTEKFNAASEELREAKTTLTLVKDKKDSLETQLDAFKTNAGSSQEEQMQKICKLSVENETLKKRLSTAGEAAVNLQAAEERIRELEDKIFAREAERKKLHNLVSELRGNVRVAVRVRPLLGKEVEQEASNGNGQGVVECDKKTQFVSLARADPKKEDFNVEYDKVFDTKTSQEDVFDDVCDLVQSALDGYQVCIFSYGQTGSGKTHTMQGGSGDMRGLIPRAVEQILATAEAMKEDGWEYTITTSFLEIYNETVNDLFKVAGGVGDEKYTIRQTSAGVEIDGLEKEPLTDVAQLDGLLARAQRNKSVASTAMNQNSSRSHCNFFLNIEGVNAKRKTRVRGALNLVDLAGSERLDRSCVSGERLKETLAINKSLSSLVDVFDALAKKKSHVPFRNSKLTFMLQGCLSGNGKTMMIVNVSPTTESAPETLCSLRFAKSVNQTELGRAKKNVASTPSDTAGSSSRPRTTPSSSSQGSIDSNKSNKSRRLAGSRTAGGARPRSMMSRR